MTNSITQLLGRISAGEDLSISEMESAIDAVMQGNWSEQQIGLLLTGLRAKGESVSEIAGAAVAMRRHMTPIRSTRSGILDTCGTGGDNAATFNISTAAALVIAAAGIPVAKHGNRSVSSKTGSADVLAELGVHIEADVARVEACLNELGICFCFAPLMHPAMQRVAAARKKLGVPTIFNLLGPLANPASAEFQLLGVGRTELRPILAQALAMLGTRRALVVHGDDGLDEITLAGPTDVTKVEDGTLQEFRWTPEDFGFATKPLDDLRVEGPAASAEMIRGVLEGETGPAREIVVMNAAAGLIAAGAAIQPHNAASQATVAIDGGAARRLLDELIEHSHKTSPASDPT